MVYHTDRVHALNITAELVTPNLLAHRKDHQISIAFSVKKDLCLVLYLMIEHQGHLQATFCQYLWRRLLAFSRVPRGAKVNGAFLGLLV